MLKDKNCHPYYERDFIRSGKNSYFSCVKKDFHLDFVIFEVLKIVIERGVFICHISYHVYVHVKVKKVNRELGSNVTGTLNNLSHLLQWSPIQSTFKG